MAVSKKIKRACIGGAIPSAEYQEIVFELKEPLATIAINRPEPMNALTVRMLSEIRRAVAAAENDERVLGIVLTGAGRGFARAWI